MTNVLLLYNDFIPSVRLCGYEQLNYLKKSGKIEFAHSNVRDLTNQQAADADVVFMVRSDSFLEMKIAEKLKKAGKYLIYVLDDDILNIPDGLSSSFYYKRKEVKNRIQRIMSLCNCLCSPSPSILKKYGSTFDLKALIEEPAILINNNLLKKTSSNKIKIGFAGSIDRSSDIDQLLEKTIIEILMKYKDKIEIEFFGSRPKLIEKYNVRHIPYENDYEKYQSQMIELAWDIGLAPMLNTSFHSCKHYNKYIEYGSFGIVGIYSNVEPYTRVIEDGHNGVLCENTTEAWVKAISELIDDSHKRCDIQQNIVKDIKERFSIDIISNNLYFTLEKELKYKSPNCQNFPIEYLKILGLIAKVINFIRINGVKFPIKVMMKLGRGK